MRHFAKKIRQIRKIKLSRRIWIISAALAAAVLFGAVAYWNFERSQSAVPRDYEGFARCLTEKGVVMYGADWCSHCENQRLAFGDSFRFVNYVECMKEQKACKAKDIRGFPTWEFPGGMREVGELSFRELSEKSGCHLR